MFYGRKTARVATPESQPMRAQYEDESQPMRGLHYDLTVAGDAVGGAGEGGEGVPLVVREDLGARQL